MQLIKLHWPKSLYTVFITHQSYLLEAHCLLSYHCLYFYWLKGHDKIFIFALRMHSSSDDTLLKDVSVLGY